MEKDIEVNEICKNCFFWKNFNTKCWVWWDRKKYCTMRVIDEENLKEKKEIYKI